MSQYAIPQIYSSCESAGCVTLIAPPATAELHYGGVAASANVSGRWNKSDQ
jgi:hypothetical protein